MGIYLWLAVGRSRDARPRSLRLVVLGAVMLALVLPAVALANHVFSDVPTSHTFHTNIANLAGAGVTAGCGGNNYCPEQPVTRGQMAGFLNRGLGRVAEADVNLGVTGLDPTQIGTVTITPGTSPGALTGARQFVHAQFIGTIYLTVVSSCPCSVNISLLNGSTALHAQPVWVTLGTVNAYVPISVAGVIPVTGSDPMTIKLVADMSLGGDITTTYGLAGNLVAETVPFGSTGTSAP